MQIDAVGDMLVRIKNAVLNERPVVDLPATKLREEIAQVLKREGFIWDCGVYGEAGKSRVLRLELKYGVNGEKVIRVVKRISKPGRREYVGAKEIGSSSNGLGIFVLSTSRGVLSDREAKRSGVGGELLCEVS